MPRSSLIPDFRTLRTPSSPEDSRITLDSLDLLREGWSGSSATGGVGGHRYWGLWYPELLESMESRVSWLSCRYSSCMAWSSVQGDWSVEEEKEENVCGSAPALVTGATSESRLTGEYRSFDR